jgi:hypothetical protein
MMSTAAQEAADTHRQESVGEDSDSARPVGKPLDPLLQAFHNLNRTTN